ncbi:microfibril-associated glycoprotein 4-like [Lingula anatina]|uniref:Microfibril-associated glycoprotein 4-like n=1 Tax=Lingula anatina TaxID=7574 RepID=A0A1S3KEX1_LINAN|nr:microfibril-associated glycoprotein 4-like [Lingula anatina]|eukprot:XP_013420999.2 microfibril-associated glycoprotein 4-like [Lingula anatina]
MVDVLFIKARNRGVSLQPRSARCLSANYHKESNACELNDKTIHDDAGTVPVADSGWVYLNPELGPPQSPAILFINTTWLHTITVTWVAGDDGGFDQTFTLDIKEASDDDSSFVTKLTMADPGHRSNVTSVLANLTKGVTYTLRLTSSNTKPIGINSSSVASNFTIDGRDCAELYKSGEVRSGVYQIHPGNSADPFGVYCDMTTDGGGWTLFQKRMDGSVDFYRGWNDYKHGFGTLSGEHWLGNDKIHLLTTQDIYELRVDMEDVSGVWAYAWYANMSISSETTNYQLMVGTYSGDAGDDLTFHSGHPFSTKDRDNDAREHGSCAQAFQGAWWYVNCHASNLNGRYLLGNHASFADGVNWYLFRGHQNSLKTTEMKIRPVHF